VSGTLGINFDDHNIFSITVPVDLRAEIIAPESRSELDEIINSAVIVPDLSTQTPAEISYIIPGPKKLNELTRPLFIMSGYLVNSLVVSKRGQPYQPNKSAPLVNGGKKSFFVNVKPRAFADELSEVSRAVLTSEGINDGNCYGAPKGECQQTLNAYIQRYVVHPLKQIAR
jgi:hypothetical protein